MDVPYWTGKSCTSLLNPPWFSRCSASIQLMRLKFITVVYAKSQFNSDLILGSYALGNVFAAQNLLHMHSLVC
jgi:hypothetical protein